MTVVENLGNLCDVYQLMNEPNSPIYRFFPSQVASIAITRGTAVIRKTYPNALIAINVSMDIWGWEHYLKNLLKTSSTAINIIGLDHYPGTWTIISHNRWNKVKKVADRIAASSPASIWFNRRLAIMETGYCTNFQRRNEYKQSQYFSSLRSISSYLKRRLSHDGFILGIYELCDMDTAAGSDPESHFGVMTSQLKAKLAFGAVKDLVLSLS